MITEIIKDELVKNKELYLFKKLSSVYFSNFINKKTLKINGGLKKTYSLIIVKANDTTNLKIKLNNSLILDGSGEILNFLPVELLSNNLLSIVGECKNLKITLIGGCFDDYLNEYLIPNLNYLVRCSGDCELLEYSDTKQIANNQMSLVNRFSNILSMQSYIVDNVNHLCYLINDNGVYFCTSLYNYANKLLIGDSVVDALISVNSINNLLYLVFIKNNRLYYKTLDLENNLSEEIEIINGDNLLLVKLLPIEYIDTNNITLFVCSFDNNITKLYMLYNNVFYPILALNNKKIRFIIEENTLEVIIINDYKVSITKYNIDTSKDIKNLLSKQNQITKENYNNCIKSNSKYIFYNFEAYEIIDENNI